MFTKTSILRCLLFLVFFIRATAFAQYAGDIKFEHITTENFKVEKGLSQNSVKCIWQDHHGYLWFGTWDGLNRYDGYSFRIFKASTDQDQRAISNQTVNVVFEDSRSNLWIGTETGLNRYIPESERFASYVSVSNNPETISSDSILCITEDGNGAIWIGTRNGLNRYDPQTRKFRRYFLNPNNANSISSNNILSLVADKKGTLFIGTDRGLNIMNIRSGKIYHLYYVPGDSLSLSDDNINCMALGKSEQLWIGTNRGLDVFQYKKQKMFHYKNEPAKPGSLSYDQVFALLKDRNGNMWVGTNGGGLNLFRRETNDFLRYRNSSNEPLSISNDYISSLYEDQSGNIWVGTAWKGVNKINVNLEKFNHYQHEKDDPNSISSNIVWSIFQDKDGIIYLGTEDGVNAIDRAKNQYRFYRHRPGDNNSLSSNQIRSVFRDSRGYFWMGTFGAGLDQYNPFTRTFRHFVSDAYNPGSLSNNTVWRIIEDRSGNVWIATANGLNRYDRNEGRFTVFKHDAKNKYSISGNSILWIFEDSKGYIWVSTYSGLNVYDPRSGRFYQYHHEAGNPVSLSSEYVFGVLEARNGIIWVATMGGGLNRLDRRTGIFRHYTEKDGLANNVVYNIFEDKGGKLWMTTNNGLSRFDPKTEDFVNYDVKDGIQGNEFNLGAAYHNKLTDEILIGGMGGFNAFIPSRVKSNKYIPPVVISAFRIFDKLQEREVADGDTIRLSYYDNFFSFEFSALDFSNPSKNQYAYTLENFDKEWIFTDAYKRFAGYTNVSPGTYIFRVRGSNSDGVWNEKGISVVIIISPAWWMTWWFRIAVFLVLAFLLWYIIYSRLRRIKIKHEDEKRILEIEKQMFSLEQTALRLQINPHFIFNSLNSIQSFVIANDTDKAINYLAKFAQLMRLILSNSQQSFIPISEEVKSINIYLDIERLRFNNKFDYEIIIDPAIDTEFTEIPPMIIQPYIENAILHGILNKKTQGHIVISMKLKGNSLLCVVEDDGIGREAATAIKARSDLHHKSRGMLITQKRLELLNKQNKEQMSVNIIDLKDEQGQPTGTRVEIIISFSES